MRAPDQLHDSVNPLRAAIGAINVYDAASDTASAVGRPKCKASSSKREILDTINELERGTPNGKSKGKGKVKGKSKGKGKSDADASQSSWSADVVGVPTMKGGKKSAAWASPMKSKGGDPAWAPRRKGSKGSLIVKDGTGSTAILEDSSSGAARKKNLTKKASRASFGLDCGIGQESPPAGENEFDKSAVSSTTSNALDAPTVLSPAPKKKKSASPKARSGNMLQSPPSSMQRESNELMLSCESVLPVVRGSHSSIARVARNRGSALRGACDSTAPKDSPNELLTDTVVKVELPKTPKKCFLLRRKKAGKKKVSKRISVQKKPTDEGEDLEQGLNEMPASVSDDWTPNPETADWGPKSSVMVWLERSRMDAALRLAEDSLRKPSRKPITAPEVQGDTLSEAAAALSPRALDATDEILLSSAMLPEE